MRKLLLAAACVIAVGVQAKAAPLVTVTTTDDIYGSFSGSIAQGATGADAMLSWSSAGSFWTGSIGLTENGIVVADIQTNADDIYVLGSGDAVIGSPCTSTECVEITNNVPISLYSAINAANGDSGICCGGSDVFVTMDVPVPEPATFAILGTAVLGIGAARRRFR